MIALELLENIPSSLSVLGLGWRRCYQWFELFPTPALDEALGHALRMLPNRCPQLAHTRLLMEWIKGFADEDRMGRCGTRSNRDHAALGYLSSDIHDAFVPRCVIRGCSEVAMDPEIRLEFCCVGIESGLIWFTKVTSIALGDATM